MAKLYVVDAERAPRGNSLSGGDEPPYDSRMEARIAKLEATVDHLATKEQIAEVGGTLKTIVARLDDIQRQLSDKPSKLWTAWVSCTIIMAVMGFSFTLVRIFSLYATPS